MKRALRCITRNQALFTTLVVRHLNVSERLSTKYRVQAPRKNLGASGKDRGGDRIVAKIVKKQL
jgi:hypothetical protein